MHDPRAERNGSAPPRAIAGPRARPSSETRRARPRVAGDPREALAATGWVTLRRDHPGGQSVDEQQRREIEAQLDKLGRDAQKIAENAKDALGHLRTGDLQLACDIVALSHYPIGHVKADHDALMEAFTVAGIEPGAGR